MKHRKGTFILSFTVLHLFFPSVCGGEESSLFSHYYVKPTNIKNIAKPNLSSHPDATYFATRITQAVDLGPNFAGKYTLASWGCGTNCLMAMIISAKTGNIIADLSSCGAIEYRLDSNLVIINPTVYEGEKVEYPQGCKVSYLLLNDGKLSELMALL